MKHNNFSSVQKIFFLFLLLLISYSFTSASNENEAIKMTFLVTCLTITTIFIIFYISKKMKGKN